MEDKKECQWEKKLNKILLNFSERRLFINSQIFLLDQRLIKDKYLVSHVLDKPNLQCPLLIKRKNQ